ncbi:MAG TPA: cyanase [Cellvibrionaceae bacterium]
MFAATDKETMTSQILQAKKAQGVTWETMGNALGVSEVWLASVCLGMNSAPGEKAAAIAEYLNLSADITDALMAFPTKIWKQTVPTDPLIYRLYEIVGVYGDTLKHVIQEKFGDGIMSAIDFSMEVKKEENTKGDRVVLELNGKFLPYRSW